MAAPTVTIFTSIQGIAQSLHDADPSLPVEVIQDDALNGYGGTIHFDPPSLRPETKLALKNAKILISEPAVVTQLLEHDASALSSLRWCQSTYAGVDPIFNSSSLTYTFPLSWKLTRFAGCFGPPIAEWCLARIIGHRWCQSTYAGVEAIFNNSSLTNTFLLSWKLTRFAGCFGPPIAEWCLARIIGHERHFAASAEDQNKKSWAGSKDAILGYRYLSSLTLSVLGCGDIGRCVAKAAKAFGMKTVGYGKTSRKSDELLEGIDEYTTSLPDALQKADYIVSVLPSTTETRGLLNGTALIDSSKMFGGKCPVFINVGRGDVIGENSLLGALDSQWISAAILDVFEVEPLPKESRLWCRSDVVISPHVSGLTQRKDVPKVFLENYRLFVEGRELKYVVDW
eukprot:CAMPEP_0201902882 /NCGR_PEP_ID=MMETSP0902-20130614/55184_1 /ASSEMBLY_ACC=CAM_ASM_000551 /TAXON_ID=420261 /ORGANISM="Thalassiosira antarctica, Strain CCMP982" /LENGTH=397 /DNA_ID=CAMNT_0048436899 /DNA_START=41 /DNA_END=1231 /DNA_ORIENTATION=+